MRPFEKMIERCYTLGQNMPNGVNYDIIRQIFIKIIVQEHVQDDNAFEAASKAYSEGFNNLPLGGTDND